MMKKILTLFLAALLALAFPAAAAESADVTFTLGDSSGDAGALVNVSIRISTDQEINSIALYDLVYDTDALTFVGFDDYSETEKKCLFGGGFDAENQMILLALKKSEALDTVLGNIRFRIKDDAASGTYSVTMSAIVKNNADAYTTAVTEAAVTVTGTPRPAVHVHTMQFTPAAAPSCLYSGNIAYWSCTVCGRNYTDADGITEAVQVMLPRNPDNHTGETVSRGQCAPTADTDGYTGDLFCASCGDMLKAGTVIPASSYTDAPWDNPFYDVKEGDAYYDAVRFVNQNGLFIGISEHLFAPEMTMDRSMFVTVLGRLAGIDPNAYRGRTTPFLDVEKDAWYTPYVAWATEEGIVLGRGDGTFGTTQEVTVEQATSFLARYARYTGQTTETEKTLPHSYTDTDEISDWACDDMRWAVTAGIYSGDGKMLAPRSAAKRSLVADMLLRYAKNAP